MESESKTEINIGGAILSLFPPLEAVFGVFKRLINFKKSYHHENITKPENHVWHDDRIANTVPYAFALSRTAVIALTALLIIGFLGTLTIPIPGITPIAVVGALAIAKACGIIVGYTTAARALTGFCGVLIDTYKMRTMLEVESPEKKGKMTKSKLIFGITGHLIISLHVFHVLHSIVKRCARWCCLGGSGISQTTRSNTIYMSNSDKFHPESGHVGRSQSISSPRQERPSSTLSSWSEGSNSRDAYHIFHQLPKNELNQVSPSQRNSPSPPPSPS